MTNELDSTISFGNYTGKTIQEIIAIDKSYIDWCVENIEDFNVSDAVKNYMQEVTNGIPFNTVDTNNTTDQQNNIEIDEEALNEQLLEFRDEDESSYSYDDDDDDYDDSSKGWGSSSSWKHYNDDLDMDQQSQEFWNQF